MKFLVTNAPSVNADASMETGMSTETASSQTGRDRIVVGISGASGVVGRVLDLFGLDAGVVRRWS